MNLHINECPGNMGLKDMIMAFDWIQENIKAFGGDPEIVTALGSSSGATMIHALLLLPTIKRKFSSLRCYRSFHTSRIHLKLSLFVTQRYLTELF